MVLGLRRRGPTPPGSTGPHLHAAGNYTVIPDGELRVRSSLHRPISSSRNRSRPSSIIPSSSTRTSRSSSTTSVKAATRSSASSPATAIPTPTPRSDSGYTDRKTAPDPHHRERHLLDQRLRRD
jgi:hypothetical protein